MLARKEILQRIILFIIIFIIVTITKFQICKKNGNLKIDTGHENLVKINDVAYAFHGLFFQLVIVTQLFLYPSGGQKVRTHALQRSEFSEKVQVSKIMVGILSLIFLAMIGMAIYTSVKHDPEAV